MKLTLTYEGPLPPRQRGVSPIKAELRKAFHPQIKRQVSRLLTDSNKGHMISSTGGEEFLSPAHSNLRTAAELDILLLSPPGGRPGDVDNRLKTLIDGLTRPANAQQMRTHEGPAEGGPTYCLLDDDNLVQQIRLDSRVWYEPSASTNSALVVVTATIVLGENADMNSPMQNIFFVI